MIPTFVTSLDFALAHQLLRECLGVKAITDDEFHRIKLNALNSLPDDQQTPLRDITPSKNPEDYCDTVREVAQKILDLHNKKIKQNDEEMRKDKKKLLLSSADEAL